MAKADFFAEVRIGPSAGHVGLFGSNPEYIARDRMLTPAARKRVAAMAARDHRVAVAEVMVVWVHEFPQAYKDGSIGEVNVRYNAHNEAIYGLYADGHISCWAD